jgi:hypothetical protein
VNKGKVYFIMLALYGLFTTIRLFYVEGRWDKKETPKVVKPAAIQNHEGEIQRVLFIRHLLGRYFNYDSATFTQLQTSILDLMTEELRAKRTAEIDRISSKVTATKVNQRGNLRTISWLGDLKYQAKVHVAVDENGRKSSLASELEIELQESEITVSNPWGLKIRALNFRATPVAQTALPKKLNLSLGHAGLISFPCYLKSNSASKPYRVKESSESPTDLAFEVQEIPEGKLEDLNLKVACSTTSYDIASTGESKGLVFVAIDQEFQVAAAQPPKTTNSNKESVEKYSKPVEDQMGFTIKE